MFAKSRIVAINRTPLRSLRGRTVLPTPHINLTKPSAVQNRLTSNMSEAFKRPTRSLFGRAAIVSGAGAAGDGIGNGRASAILLAEAGCSVVCVDMKKDLAQRTVEMIEKDGFGKAVAVQANATVAEDCKNAVDTAVKEYGRLDICKSSFRLHDTYLMIKQWSTSSASVEPLARQ